MVTATASCAFSGLFRRNYFQFWLGHKAMQNILCSNKLSHVSTTRTRTNAHTSMKTPVERRQLRVTVQAACKQSKEQNWFRVVREKREEWAGKREQKVREYGQLLFWCRCFQNCEMETLKFCAALLEVVVGSSSYVTDAPNISFQGLV